MLTHRRAIRKRKRRHKELEGKERTNGKKETGSDVEEGQPEKKKTKRKKSKNRKRRWRMKEPKSNISAHKTNIIEDEGRQDRETKDDGEEVSYQKNVYKKRDNNP